jgi:tetratricopeptide (TPR) repeat protein
LRERDGAELAAALIGVRGEFVARCLERAGGNPLFLEQLLRHTANLEGDGLPGSVQSSVLARVDRLAEAHKSAIRAAAALGQRVGLAAWRAVLGRPDYDPAPLVANFLLRPEGGDYVFAHALIRDGVYHSLLQADRRDLHRRAALWYAGRDLVLRAEHLDRAQAPDAAEAYGAAARQELAAYRYESALRLAERGRDLAAGAAAAELECLIGDVLEALGRTAEMLESYRRAEAAADGAVTRARAWIGQAAGLRVADKIDDAIALLDRAEPPLREAELHVDLARLLHLRGNLWFPKGNVAACRAPSAPARRNGWRARRAAWATPNMPARG